MCMKKYPKYLKYPKFGLKRAKTTLKWGHECIDDGKHNYDCTIMGIICWNVLTF